MTRYAQEQLRGLDPQQRLRIWREGIRPRYEWELIDPKTGRREQQTYLVDPGSSPARRPFSIGVVAMALGAGLIASACLKREGDRQQPNPRR